MMLSIGKLALIAFVVVLLFKGKDLPKIFGELGRGITQFRKGLNAPDETTHPTP